MKQLLRFDERGIRKSTGDFSAANFNDFSDNVIQGIEYLKNRKETKNSIIGLIGHSKGGSTAMIASDRSKLIKFMVLLGAISVPIEENIYQEIRLEERAKNTSETFIEATIQAYSYIFKVLKSEKNNSIVNKRMELFYENQFLNTSGHVKQNWEIIKKNIFTFIEDLCTPWSRSSIKFDPGKILSRTKIPVLAIWGSKDMIIPSNVNLIPMKTALESAKNKNFSLIVIDSVNHEMQTSRTGFPDEYQIIEETVSPKLLDQIKKWIHQISL
ncbi:hypothetical protein BpHYR1_045687 [Brachionus plicatilis]|uniref:BAAT/Acyl-CoA thioester hydrolase C-terminal domain-containing protein n=1 Tax=Brachionus plicatilis TaxID=10195 RepID=A0A3M7QG68_BRAPC|nr:hypothetical protein BpHYR1_045687 [Brachionus plicatilis]